MEGGRTVKTRKRGWITEISGPEDLPEPLATIAEWAGVEKAIEMVDKFGGERIYIPCLSTLRRQVRNRKIMKEFTGYNLRSVAQKYRLSAQSIRNIVKDVQPKRKKSLKIQSEHEQLGLF